MVTNDFSDMRLGKLEARYLEGIPPLSAYTAKLPLPPGQIDYTHNLWHLGAMANNQISDCTAAAVGHAIQVWTSVASTETVVPDVDIIKLYAAVSGYTPGDANTDHGAYASEILKYWYKNPIDGHALAGIVFIRPGNRTSLREAIYLLGICYIGVALPLAAKHSDWTLPYGQALTDDWLPGSWGGHAVPACAYDVEGLTVISWGKLVKMSWNFLDAYCDEAYGLLSKDWMTELDNSPPGFCWQALQDDMRILS